MTHERCETCRWWARGSTYTSEPYGNTPARVGWSAAAGTGQYLQQHGQCRIVAPWRSNGEFPETWEFQGCGEWQEKRHDA